VDRKNTYRYVNNIQFPILDDTSFATMHHDTLIDGELVLDVESNGRVVITTNIKYIVVMMIMTSNAGNSSFYGF
jgi:hypothetical protein